LLSELDLLIVPEGIEIQKKQYKVSIKQQALLIVPEGIEIF
jgi:cupin superfamily acireductone dioxygenase involved in methionine salvage